MTWGRGAQFDPRRSGWNLLFVTDSAEMMWTWDPEEATYSRQPSIISEQWLRGLEKHFKFQRKHSASLGAPPQPAPISMQHVIEERVYWGWVGDIETLRRMGSVYAVHYHAGGPVDIDGASVDVPAGLWSLNEWTSEGIARIRDGSWLVLSPTTVRDLEMTDGTVLEGDSLYAVGLVDSAALDSIGTARDILPWTTWPTGDAKPLAVSADDGVSQLDLRGKLVGADAPALEWSKPLIGAEMQLRRNSRQLVFAREAAGPRPCNSEGAPTAPDLEEPTMKPKTKPTERSATQDPPATEPENEDTEPATEPAAAVTPRATEPSAPAAPAAPASTPPPVPASPSFLERARDLERRLHETNVQELITARRLLARNADAVLQRMAVGEAYDDLLGDYASPVARAGSGSTAEPEGASVPTTRATVEIGENALVEECEAAAKDDPEGPPAYARFLARKKEITAAGGRVLPPEE